MRAFITRNKQTGARRPVASYPKEARTHVGNTPKGAARIAKIAIEAHSRNAWFVKLECQILRLENAAEAF